MKKFLALCFIAVLTIPTLGATFAGSQKTQETYFDAAATDPVSHAIPTTGKVITMTVPGYVFITPVSGNIVANLTATTPNANTYSLYIPSKGIGTLQQFYRIGEKFSLISVSGATVTANVTIQRHRVVNE